MTTSIAQARPLLSAAELELFDQSRADPIKLLTARQLDSKEKRSRTLRDKYRDLYRRQTVAQRGKGSPATHAASEANARTQRKGEIMQEILERFEARSVLLESRSQREAQQAPGKPLGKTAAAPKPAKSSAPPAPPSPATAPAAAKKTAPRPSPAEAKSVKPGNAKSAAKGSSPAGVKNAPVADAAREPTRAAAPLSAVKALGKDAQSGMHVEHLTGQDPTGRSHKSPSDRAPTSGGKAQAPQLNAPLDILPSATRSNPVRNLPANIAIQGHLSSTVRRAQGKKDSRE